MRRPLAPLLPFSFAAIAGVLCGRAGLEVGVGVVAVTALLAIASRRAEFGFVTILLVGMFRGTPALPVSGIAGEARIREACVGDARPSGDGRVLMMDGIAQGIGEPAFRARILLPGSPDEAPRAGKSG